VNASSGKIASSILGTMDETKTRCNLYFMVVFFQSYFMRHVKWLQMIDERAGDFGYLSCHMPVRMYLIICDLENLANRWDDDEQYQKFMELMKTCVRRVAVEEGRGQETNQNRMS
jgi:hypothetical protein